MTVPPNSSEPIDFEALFDEVPKSKPAEPPKLKTPDQAVGIKSRGQSDGMSRGYVAGWCVMALLAMGYLGVIAVRPDFATFGTSATAKAKPQYQLDTARAQIGNLNTQIRATQGKISGVNKKLAAMQQQQSKSQVTIAALQQRIIALSTANTTLTQQLAGLNAQIDLDRKTAEEAKQKMVKRRVVRKRKIARKLPKPKRVPKRVQAKVTDRLGGAANTTVLNNVKINPLPFTTEVLQPQIIVPTQ